jgi:hypothetical protein
MRRTFCIVLLAAAAAMPAQADIRHGKPLDRPIVRHAVKHPGKALNIKGLGAKDAFAGCSALIAAGRDEIPPGLIATCIEASPPVRSPPSAQQPRIAGPSIVAGPGACSVIGEVGRSC